MFNKVLLMGHLTKDVVLTKINGGTTVATVGLAVNNSYKRRDGSKAEEVMFIDCKLFEPLVIVAQNYFYKGSKVLLEGRLTFEQWNDREGVKRSKHSLIVTNITMIDMKPKGVSRYQQENNGGYKMMSKDEVDVMESYIVF
jgi:single-strand DNA-binding protein